MVKKWQNITFRKRLILSISLLFVIIMSIYSFILTTRHSRFLLNELKNQSIVYAQSIAQSCKPWVLSEDIAGLSDIISGYIGEQDLQYVIIFDNNGKILAHTKPEFIGKYLSDSVSVKVLTTENEDESFIKTKKAVEVFYPVKQKNTIVGWVRINMTTKFVYYEIRKNIQESILVLFIAIVLGIVLAVIISRGITKRINSLISIMQKIQGGERKIRCGINENNEIGKLAKGFDSMLEALEIEEKKYHRTSEELLQLNEKLEEKITERTHVIEKNFEIIKNLKILNERIIDSSPIGIFACNYNGDCVIANRAIAKISGTTVENMLTLNFRQLPQWKINGLFEKAVNVLENKVEEYSEIHLTTSFGNEKWLSYWFSPFIENGTPHFLMMAEDITERKQLELKKQELMDELRSTIELLEMTTKAAGMGIWVWDVPSNSLEWNKQMFEIYGIPEQNNLPYDIWRKNVHKDDIKIVEQKLQDHIKGTGKYDLVFRIVLPNEEIRYIEAIASIERNDSGEAIRMVGYNRDITQRKLHEEASALRLKLGEKLSTQTTEEMLQAFLDKAEQLLSSQIGFFHAYDAKNDILKLVTWSTNTLKHMCTAEGAGSHYPLKEAGVWADAARLGYPIIHNNFSEVPDQKGMPKGHAEIVREIVVPVLRNNVVTAILGLGNKKSDYTEEDKNLLLQMADWTMELLERKQVHLALKESEERYRTIFDNSPDAYLIMELENGLISDCNKATEILLQGPREQIVGKTPDELSPPHQSNGQTSKDAAIARINETIKKGNNRFEWIHRRFDESDFWVEVTITVLTIDGRQVFFVAWRDISENKKILAEIEIAQEKLKQQTAELIQSEKMSAIGTLTAGVAHELNNPLMGILNYAGYCKENTQPDNKTYPILNDLIDEAERSAEIVKSLLTFTRKDEDSNTSSFNTNIVDVIKESLRLLKLKAQNKHIKIKLHQTSNPIFGNIKPGHLMQIIFNLVDNAIFAVENSPTKKIEILISEDVNSIIVRVTDTGKGISPEKINLIFDPFYTTKPVGQGTGLGLSICKNMIEENGGTITCVSSMEKGTTFSIHIPKRNNKNN